jgi:hypothetical protein
MPYVVTTKRPRPQEGGCGEILAVVSRRAGGTLEEAQAEAHRIVNAQPHRLSDPLWNNAIEAWPKSGGTVGPLPDGTVIEVEPVEWYWLYDKSGYGRTSQASDDTVIAAFNAREVA